MDELSHINWMLSRLKTGGSASGEAAASVVTGAGDDAAVLRLPEANIHDLLFCADAVCEGVHFLLRGENGESGGTGRGKKSPEADSGTSGGFPPLITPRDAGWKLLAENLSDIAAMGGEPLFSVATCHVPRGTPDGVLRGIFDGLLACAEKFGVAHVGGDLAECRGALSLSLSLLGRVERGKALLRSGASGGDILYVTGELGGSIFGQHARFIPRLAEGRLLSKHGATTACIDISDGLALDLHRLLDASGKLGVEIEENVLPVSGDAFRYAKISRKTPIEHALGDGEDFELLFTARPEYAGELEKTWERNKLTRLTRIGRITDSGSPRLLLSPDGSRRPLPVEGWVHEWDD